MRVCYPGVVDVKAFKEEKMNSVLYLELWLLVFVFVGVSYLLRKKR